MDTIFQGMCRKLFVLILLFIVTLPLVQAQHEGWVDVSFAPNDWAISRHESAFVQAGDRFYTLGGRGNTRRVQAFDYTLGKWVDLAKLPKDTSGTTIEIHHAQPVVHNGLVYMLGAFTGNFPNETPITKVIIYDPVANDWIFGADIPVSRQRGSAGCVVYNDKIYLVCGITNGHVSGWVNWVDMYDPATNTWTQLADAPRARDHFHAALYNGKIYATSGRRTGSAVSVFGGTVDETDVYDIATDSWTTEANIPTPRAGAMSAVMNHPTHGNILMVMGGEIDTSLFAFSKVEAFDLTANSWLGASTMPDMNVPRHGTQAIVSNSAVYLAAGASPERGGSTELTRFDSSYIVAYYPDTTAPSAPTGTAITKGTMTDDSTSYSFGTVQVGATVSRTVKVDNTGGNQGIVITEIIVTGTDSADFALSLPYTLPITVAPGTSFQFDLDLTPSGSGAISAALNIIHSGSNGTIVTPLSGTGSTTFPVELLGFRAKAINGSVQLSWETASEQNSDYFGIERSLDGHMFEEIERVEAVGYSDELVSYKTADYQPLIGKSYYRLRQVDLDGSMTHSDIVEISINDWAFKVFPNPLEGKSTLHILGSGLPGEDGYLRIRNVLGQEILRESIHFSEGRLERDLQLESLIPGMYIIQLDIENGFESVSQLVQVR